MSGWVEGLTGCGKVRGISVAGGCGRAMIGRS